MIWDHDIRAISLQQPVTTVRVVHTMLSTLPYFLVIFSAMS